MAGPTRCSSSVPSYYILDNPFRAVAPDVEREIAPLTAPKIPDDTFGAYWGGPRTGAVKNERSRLRGRRQIPAAFHVAGIPQYAIVGSIVWKGVSLTLDTLRIYVLWHPQSDTCGQYAEAIAQHFDGLGMEREGVQYRVPVRFRSEAWETDPGPPRPITLGEAHHNAILHKPRNSAVTGRIMP